MENTNKLLYLLEEIKGKVQYLENALDEIDQVKKSLKVTSADVKAHIRDSISRHLEALRNREIWLLTQTELIEHGKEDVLSEKQNELLELVGGMKKVCDLLEQSSEAEKLGEIEVFEDQLSDLIKSVEKMSIAPEEGPNILFTAQNLDLLETIRGFGRVDCDCSKEEAQISSILKNMNLSDTPGNKRKFITSSGPIENSLLHEEKHSKSQPDSTSHSIEKWLTKCQEYSGCDMESEVGYSEKSEGDNVHWILPQRKRPNQERPDILLGYFNEVKMSSPTNWIRQSTKTLEQPTILPLLETYSKIASLGTENWLLYKQERNKMRSLPADLGKIHSLDDCNTKWLKPVQVGNLPETSTGKAFAALAASNTNQWLRSKKSKQQNCNGKKGCSDCDKWLLTSSNSSVVTKNDDYPDSLSDADWLRVKDVEVISIENLDSIFSSCSTKTNESCDQSVNCADNAGVKKYNAMLQSQPNEDWLQRSAPSEKENQQSTMMEVLSESMKSNDYDKWLVKPSGLPSDICKWLARSSQERCKNCPPTCSKGLFSLFDSVKETSSENWLQNSE